MTHDAMWYYHSLQVAPDRANKLNQDAASMSAVEIKRILN